MTRTVGRLACVTVIAMVPTLVCSPAQAQHIEDLATLMVREGAAAPLATAVGFSDAGWAARFEQAMLLGKPITGALTVLLVPAIFSDSPDPLVTTDDLSRLFFTGPATPGTLREFFDAASGGLLRADGASAPWYRTSVSLEAATGGDSSVFGIGPDFGAYLLEAIAAADQVLDFRQFDNDGPDGIPDSGDDNGTVDALTFLFVERPRSCGGPGVWPHKSGLAPRNGNQPYLSNDVGIHGSPIRADGYVIISAANCDGSGLSSIAIVAHELGHELRLPDLYHPQGQGLDAILSVNRRWVVGCFGLMAGGAWGCGPADEFPSFGPTHFSPWSRDQLRWIHPDTVGDVRRREYRLEPVQTSQQVLQVPLDDNGIEWILFEFRPARGFDADLPASGVLAYRWNHRGVLRPHPDGTPHYLIRLMEADGDSALVRTHAEGGNRGVAGDVFAVSGTAVLNALTHPGTRLADGSPTSVTIHSIIVANDEARIVVSTAETPGIVGSADLGSVAALTSLSHDIPIGGGALPYSVIVNTRDAPAGIAITTSNDLLSVSGTPLQTGTFEFNVEIHDDRGVVGFADLRIVVGPVVFADSVLLLALLQPFDPVLTGDQRAVLDNDGNQNGKLDVGDLRRYLLRRGS